MSGAVSFLGFSEIPSLAVGGARRRQIERPRAIAVAVAAEGALMPQWVRGFATMWLYRSRCLRFFEARTRRVLDVREKRSVPC